MKLKIVACATLLACQAICPDTTPDAHAPIGVIEDYTSGDIHQISAWLGHRVSDCVSLSSRLNYLDRDNVHGIDPKIVAPVQTADPSRQGAERLDLSLGVNFLFPNERQRLAIELSKPISQKLADPQLMRGQVLLLS